ncbi:MAG: amidohydrolase family protein [Saprospiraceae bacterium]|nr:amidohydrolase family protein [Saprospiraceae bacterium]
MDILIKEVIVLHPTSDHHQQEVDIHISNGNIKKIGKNLNINADKIIKGSRLYCCIGLCDIGVHTGEPGNEHRETISSVTQAALSGGYTALAVFPDTKPVMQTKASIGFIKNHRERHGVDLYLIGALSKDVKGVDIAEYMDMKQAGIIAVSDGMNGIDDTSLMSRALQYASTLALPVIHHPCDHHLSAGGEMHEGVMSTSMGMRGIPSIAELNMVQRDTLLQSYNGGTIIEHAISASESVEAIRTAKKQNQNITATVAYMNLLHTDEDLVDFDSNLKVQPVLRSESDRLALVNGLKDGTIDAIVSNHTPLDEEAKNLEFPYATPGAIGLETCLAAVVDGLSNDLNLSEIITKMTVGPRQLLGLEIPEIKEGAKVNIAVFDTNAPWSMAMSDIVSKSKNSPYIDKQFKTKVVFVLPG